LRPDAEDVIVVGFLVALPLWLFAGLPLLDWFSMMDHQHQATEFGIVLLPVLFAFLGGAVMSSVLAGIYRWVDPANFVGTFGSRKGLLRHHVPWQPADT
jgi:hypothetical protein